MYTQQNVPLIRLAGVQKILGSRQVLADVTLDIYAGEVLGVIGASGAGKTTLFRSLVGFYEIDGGDISFEGRSVKSNISLIRSIVGFASQDGCFYSELSVEENLLYFASLYGIDSQVAQVRSNMLLDLVDLADSKQKLAANLSGGMKKRLDLAIALIHSPRVLILDEPTTGLDAKLRKSMLALIQRINALGTTIIISSHIMEDMDHLCSRVCMLFGGRLLAAASPAQLKAVYSRNEEIHLESYPGKYTAIVMELKKRNVPLALYSFHEHKLVLYTTQAEFLLGHLLDILRQNNEHLVDLDVNRPSLNEVFESFSAYYGGKNGGKK